MVRLALLAVSATLLLFPMSARADAVECNGQWALVGDSEVDLLGKCGEPSLREVRTEEKQGITYDKTAQAGEAKKVTEVIERWTYNFGPQRFVQYVTLAGGRVRSIQSGGYGYVSAQADGKPTAGAVPVARCDAMRSFNVGDKVFDVLARCGEPASRETRHVELASLATDASGNTAMGASSTTIVEIWTYNFGSSSFLRRLIFRDGVLVKIETGGYGYGR
jgi:hypothetical protein